MWLKLYKAIIHNELKIIIVRLKYLLQKHYMFFLAEAQSRSLYLSSLRLCVLARIY